MTTDSAASSSATLPAAPSLTSPAADRSFGAALSVVVVAAGAMVATLPGRSHGLGLITEPLLAELEIDRVTFGQMNLWGTLLGALFCFPAGRFLDRYGPRTALACTSAALGFVVVAMSVVVAPWALFGLITLTRGLGQSALSVVSIALVGKSFDRRVHWPMAAYSVLLSVGFMFAFPAVRFLVERYGWRGPWTGVGLLLVGFAVASWSTLGGLGRGARPSTTDHDAGGDGLSLSAALATPAFWIFAGAASLFGLAYSGLGLFNEDVLRERGLNAYYASTLAVSAPFGLVGQALGGRFARRVSYQRLTTAALGLYAVGLVGLTRVVEPAQLYAVVSLLGFAGEMITVLFFAVWSQLFGQRHLGRIQGAAQMATVLASAVGPLAFAECRVRAGSYFPILYALAGVVAVVGVAAWFVASPPASSESQPHVD